MNRIIQEHKTPIAVTIAGLLVVVGLASAPALLADSDTDILAAKNSSELQKLAAALEEKSNHLQQQLDSQSNQISSRIDTLENQVLTLNKAVKQLHLRQRSIQDPSGSIQSSITQMSSNVDNRIVTLEKAVTKLHRMQQRMIQEVEHEDHSTTPESKPEVSLASTNQAELSIEGQPTSSSMVRRDIVLDLKVRRMEKTIERLQWRLDEMEIENREREPLIDHLSGIRDSVNELLNNISE